MTVLCDWQIRELCEASQMVWPFRPDLLNPVSIDVVLGHHLMIEVMDSKELIQIDISTRTEDDPYMLLPGEFCLAETFETFNLPSTVSAQFERFKRLRQAKLTRQQHVRIVFSAG